MTVYREPGLKVPTLYRDNRQCWSGDLEPIQAQHARELVRGEARRAAWRAAVEAVRRTRKAVRR